MKKHLFAAFILLAVSAFAQEEEFNMFTSLELSAPMKNHLGGELIRVDGTVVPAEELTGKVIGLLFSASWDDQYIDELKALYTKLQAAGEPFEIVWVSADSDEKSMMDFFRSKKMPWLAVKFDRLRILNLRFQYGVRFDPSLVIVNSPGAMFTTSALGDLSVLSGVKAYNKWKALRPMPFPGQEVVSSLVAPGAPLDRDPVKLGELLQERAALAGDVVELEFNRVQSIELLDNAFYQVRISYQRGDVSEGFTDLKVPAEGYLFFKHLLSIGESRRTVFVQVTHPGYLMKAIGNDYHKRLNEYSWE